MEGEFRDAKRVFIVGKTKEAVVAWSTQRILHNITMPIKPYLLIILAMNFAMAIGALIETRNQMRYYRCTAVTIMEQVPTKWYRPRKTMGALYE